eukprot:8416091-Pyramimonas_sp.AAC.1
MNSNNRGGRRTWRGGRPSQGNVRHDEVLDLSEVVVADAVVVDGPCRPADTTGLRNDATGPLFS